MEVAIKTMKPGTMSPQDFLGLFYLVFSSTFLFWFLEVYFSGGDQSNEVGCLFDVSTVFCSIL